MALVIVNLFKALYTWDFSQVKKDIYYIKRGAIIIFSLGMIRPKLVKQ